jgi:hypothetical protein
MVSFANQIPIRLGDEILSKPSRRRSKTPLHAKRGTCWSIVKRHGDMPQATNLSLRLADARRLEGCREPVCDSGRAPRPTPLQRAPAAECKPAGEDDY